MHIFIFIANIIFIFYRWHKNHESEWQGVFSGIIWKLKQDSCGNLLYIGHNPSDIDCKSNGTKRQKLTKSRKLSQSLINSTGDLESILRNYFNLHLKLEDFYSKWNVADENFKQISKHFPGIRILRQDPVENLFSFICSANNNIPRYYHIYHRHLH